MFGMHYHSLSTHFAEYYRIVSLRSLNAENQERYFKDIKSTMSTTNYDPDHILVNCLLRLQVKKHGQSFLRCQTRIEKEARRLPPRPNNIITRQMIEENVLAFAAHKKRIADYLLDGCWHEENDGNWVFYDCEATNVERVSPNLRQMHIRYKI